MQKSITRLVWLLSLVTLFCHPALARGAEDASSSLLAARGGSFSRADKGVALAYLQADFKVTGKVTNENGEGLPGATVVVKGTSNGTTTDQDGAYTLSVPSESDVLVFSFIGFATQEISLNGRTTLNVTLTEDTPYLDEVVVVGYGTMRRRDVIGAAAAIKGDEIAKVPVASVAEALTGRMAGVQVLTTDGQPGADIVIKVRGGTSISQDNAPLYIIDGFPSDDGIKNLSPSDIERIDVLKDASSTAIYGARGANGVILITTRGGAKGKGSVTYDGWAGFRQLGRQLDVMNASEFVRYQYERQSTIDGPSDSFTNRYGPWESLSRYDDVDGINWQDEVLGGNAYYQNHNISIGGGNDVTNYRIGYSRNDENGLFVNNGYSRDYFKLRLDQKVTDRLKLSTNAMYSRTKTTGDGMKNSDAGLRSIVMFRPTSGLDGDEFTREELLDTDEDELSGLVNPETQAKSEHRLTLNGSLMMNAALDYKIMDGLTFRLLGGMTIGNVRREEFDDSNSGEMVTHGGPYGFIRITDNKKFNNTALLTYAKTFQEKHSVNVVLGQEFINDSYKMVEASSAFYDSDDIGLANLALGNQHPKPESREESEKLLSYFGRVFYSFNERYQFSGTLRADGSSKFIDKNRWGYFPSASVAWQASEEPFLKGVNSLSNLKFRLTYGVAGNNRISNNQYASTFTNTYYAADGTSLSAALIPNATANPDLKWETTISRNLGVDLGFFNDRISLNVDVYQNTTKDLLLNTNIPSSSGYKTQFKNVGSTENKGIELNLVTRNVEHENFTWTSDFNVAIYKNEVTGLNKEALFSQESFISTIYWSANQEAFLVKVGEPLGLIYGFVNDGFYTVDDFDYDAGTGTYTLKPGVPGYIGSAQKPGDIKFKDLGGALDDDGNPMVSPEDDRTIIGRTQPKFFGGFNNTFSYRNFDMSVFMNFSVGNDVLNANKILYSSGYSPNRNLLSVMNGYFTYINEEGQYVTDPDQLREMNKDATIWAPERELPRRVYSWAVEDGSFLRINNITLGYTLPKSISQKLKISNLRVFATGYNLFLFTNYTGFDPETSAVRSTPYTPGVDQNSYPKSRAVIGGLSLTF